MRKSLRLILSEFSSELARRKVYPVVATYAIAAWILLQIGEVTFEPLGFPDWALTTLVVMSILGFPIAAALAWIVDITPSGIRRDSALELRRNPTVAVLPFTDMSPDHDQGYFCDGVAEEILSALAKIDELHVIGRMASFRYRGPFVDLGEIGAQLGADSILEGSVQKSGQQLRVTSRLINVADGQQFWAKRFDREPKDIFVIQDEIATSIVESLLNTLMPVKTTASGDVTAYEYYLRGKQFLNRFSKVDFEFARQMFRQAIQRDENFALAWSAYADCYSLEAMYSDPTPTFRGKAQDACKKALELDPNLAEAHASCGLAHLISERYEDAEKSFKNALDLNPRLYEAYFYYGRSRFHQGDMEGAADFFAKAAASNPSEYQARLLRVQVLRGVGRMDEAKIEAQAAIDVVERHLEWHPDDARALHLGAGSLIVLGEVARAESWLRRALEIDPDDSIALYNVACNFAVLNRIDESIDCLERAVQNGMVNSAWTRNDPDLQNLHGHPRYEKLIETKSKNVI